MSSALRIAAVTHVLKDLLNEGIINGRIGDNLATEIKVSSLCPAQVDKGTGSDSAITTQLNLFLYRVSHNTGWRNMGYPSRNARGEAINNPPLALNLHYLLTAFADDNELHAEVLLGYGMQLLHERPVLDRAAIIRSLTTTQVEVDLGAVGGVRDLATSGLEEQIEQIKISPEPSSNEEMSRLWTAFQARYRPCTAYVATVVLIESEKDIRPAPQVLRRQVFALPFQQPVIEQILSQDSSGLGRKSAYRKTQLGNRIFIRGHSLRRDGVYVLINGTRFDPDPADIGPREIALTLPLTMHEVLRAGVQTVQVVHPVHLQVPPVLSDSAGVAPDVTVPAPMDRGTTNSNVQAFVLSSTAKEKDGDPLEVNGSGDLTFTIEVKPNIYYKQRVVVFLHEIEVAVNQTPKAYSQTFPTDSGDLLNNQGEPIPEGIDEFEITIPDVASGTYALRLQVDGAESYIDVSPDGTFNDPRVEVEVN